MARRCGERGERGAAQTDEAAAVVRSASSRAPGLRQRAGQAAIGLAAHPSHLWRRSRRGRRPGPGPGAAQRGCTRRPAGRRPGAEASALPRTRRPCEAFCATTHSNPNRAPTTPAGPQYACKVRAQRDLVSRLLAKWCGLSNSSVTITQKKGCQKMTGVRHAYLTRELRVHDVHC